MRRPHHRARRSGVLLVVLSIACACAGSDSTAAGTDPTRVDGGSLYLRHCGGCHGAKGTVQQRESLPSIGELSRDQLEQKILHGGIDMPTFADALNEDDLDAIVDYLTD